MNIIIIFVTLCVSLGQVLFQDNFQNLNQWTHERSAVNYSGRLIPCPSVPCTSAVCYQVMGNCLQLQSKTEKGDMFSTLFANPTNISDPNDVIIVEFKYYAIPYQGKPNISSLWVGWTTADQRVFYWEASGDPRQGGGTLQAIPPVTIVDSSNQWKTIRFFIKPVDSQQIQLVFEDYDNVTSIAGQYYIGNITVVHGSNCSLGCAQCYDFQTCSICQVGFVSVNNICYNKACFDNINKITQSTLNVASTQSNGVTTLNVSLGTFDIQNCFTTSLTSINNTNSPSISYYVSSYNTLTFSLNSANISNLNCPNNGQGLYTCYFVVLTYQNNQTFMTFQFSQTFNMGLGNSTQQIYNPISVSSNQQPATIYVVINSTVIGCQIIPGAGASQICGSNTSNSTFQVTVSVPFLLTLYITDPAYQTYSIQLANIMDNGLYMSGNGTSVPLTLLSISQAPGSITFKVSIPLLPSPGIKLVVQGVLVAPAHSRLLANSQQSQVSMSTIVVQVVQNSSSSMSSQKSKVQLFLVGALAMILLI